MSELRQRTVADATGGRAGDVNEEQVRTPKFLCLRFPHLFMTSKFCIITLVIALRDIFTKG